MLVLSRCCNESIIIGNDIVIMVVRVHNNKVRLGIKAPKGVTVHRREVYDIIQTEGSRKRPKKRKGPPPST